MQRTPVANTIVATSTKLEHLKSYKSPEFLNCSNQGLVGSVEKVCNTVSPVDSAVEEPLPVSTGIVGPVGSVKSEVCSEDGAFVVISAVLPSGPVVAGG